MLNALPFSLLRYAVECRFMFFFAALNDRHTSILRAVVRAFARGLETSPENMFNLFVLRQGGDQLFDGVFGALGLLVF